MILTYSMYYSMCESNELYCMFSVEIKDNDSVLNPQAHCQPNQCDIKNNAQQIPIEKQWGYVQCDLVLLVSSSALLYSSASAWSAMLLLNVDQVCVSSPNSRLL